MLLLYVHLTLICSKFFRCTVTVPSAYKEGKSYYCDTNSEMTTSKRLSQEVPHQLNDDHVLKRECALAERVKQLYSADVSPLFADQERLVGLPPAYIIALEWDLLKDETLLYAERLREAGVPVHVAFYENAFHGIASFPSSFSVAKQMQDDLISFIKSKIDSLQNKQ